MYISFQNNQIFDRWRGWLSKDTGLPVNNTQAQTGTPGGGVSSAVNNLNNKLRTDTQVGGELDTAKFGTLEIDKLASACSIEVREDGVSVSVNLITSYFLSKELEAYEDHRNAIYRLKKIGYCDEAVDMLTTELDNQFLRKPNQALVDQLRVLGYSEEEAAALSMAFKEEYLKVRDSSGDFMAAAEKALSNLGLNTIDVKYGEPGHYGLLPDWWGGGESEKWFKVRAAFEEGSKRFIYDHLQPRVYIDPNDYEIPEDVLDISIYTAELQALENSRLAGMAEKINEMLARPPEQKEPQEKEEEKKEPQAAL